MDNIVELLPLIFWWEIWEEIMMVIFHCFMQCCLCAFVSLEDRYQFVTLGLDNLL